MASAERYAIVSLDSFTEIARKAGLATGFGRPGRKSVFYYERFALRWSGCRAEQWKMFRGGVSGQGMRVTSRQGGAVKRRRLAGRRRGAGRATSKATQRVDVDLAFAAAEHQRPALAILLRDALDRVVAAVVGLDPTAALDQ